MRLPPRWLRRLVLAPAVPLLTVVVLVTLPVWLLVLACLSPLLGGRWRLLRVLWLVVVQLLAETVALAVLSALWVSSGFGRNLRSARFEDLHYRLVQTYLELLYREARRVLGVSVQVQGPGPDAYSGRPILVFSRHAGPGDSFLLVHALVNWYDREPRIVLKDSLQWDPAVDIILNRLPNRFISAEPGRTAEVVERHIADLASDLGTHDALLIFPEGGNFTQRRRARSIARLRQRGLLDAASKAEQMRHVLAPRPGGVLAALDVAGGADVVWVAHTGLDHLFSVADVWRALPVDTTVRMQWWHVPAGDVPDGEGPDGEQARIDWLYSWWARIDDWIEANRSPTTRPTSHRSAG